jgi:hypothetical protein
MKCHNIKHNNYGLNKTHDKSIKHNTSISSAECGNKQIMQSVVLPNVVRIVITAPFFVQIL